MSIELTPCNVLSFLPDAVFHSEPETAPAVKTTTRAAMQKPQLFVSFIAAAPVLLLLGNGRVKSHDSVLLTPYGHFWKQSQSQESSDDDSSH